MGNDGLAYLQSADILLHVIRAFNDDDITHAEESVDPVRDARIIHRELIARDIETVSRALSSKDYIVNKGKCGREDMYEHQTLRKVYQVLTGSEYVPIQRGTVSYMSADMSMSRQPTAEGGSVPTSPTKQRRNLTLFPEEPQQTGE